MENWEKKKKQTLPSWSLFPTGEKTDNTQNIRISHDIYMERKEESQKVCLCVCASPV